jgi:hypothetical protein
MKVEILTDYLYIYYPCVKKGNRKEMLLVNIRFELT